MARVKLIKRKTNDGLIEVKDSVPLGRIYTTDWGTRKVMGGYNEKHDKFWKREVVFIEGSWIPTELLEVIQ